MKEMFLIPEDITYLNCANMSPMLKTVREAGLKGMDKRASPWTIKEEDWFNDAETLRTLAAKIYQTSSENISLVPSASYGLAVAAKNMNIAAGKSIIILEDQFPSNVYVWRELAVKQNLRLITIPREKNTSWTEGILKHIDANSGIVSIPNCHWTDGTYIDLEKISAAVRSVNANLILDLSQSLGALPIEIEKIDPDFAVSVGYKWLLGPLGMGYMYISERWQKEGQPLEYSWITRKDSDNFKGLTTYTDEFRAGARKFDMGEFSQFNLMPMSIAGLQQVVDWGVDHIQLEISKLTSLIVEELSVEKIKRVGHIVGLPLTGKNIEEVRKKISERKVVLSFRGNSLRISPHLYNDVGDVERLISCLVDELTG